MEGPITHASNRQHRAADATESGESPSPSRFEQEMSPASFHSHASREQKAPQLENELSAPQARTRPGNRPGEAGSSATPRFWLAPAREDAFGRSGNSSPFGSGFFPSATWRPSLVRVVRIHSFYRSQFDPHPLAVVIMSMAERTPGKIDPARTHTGKKRTSRPGRLKRLEDHLGPTDGKNDVGRCPDTLLQLPKQSNTSGGAISDQRDAGSLRCFGDLEVGIGTEVVKPLFVENSQSLIRPLLPVGRRKNEGYVFLKPE